MKQGIIAYHRDDFGDWVTELACGHYQHVRHNPPWINREWVITEAGRSAKLGSQLNCKKCIEGTPKDTV